MSFINVGARVGAHPVMTKKDLKQLVADGNTELVFYGTSDFTPFNGGLSAINGDVLSVVGPDPFNNRKWYATVRRENGKLTVK